MSENQQIIIIDYGMGNLRSVEKAIEHVGGKVSISRDPQQIRTADKIVLPGVGAIGDCMKHLREFELVDPILDHIKAEKTFLGICLGFQCLFEESLEFGRHKCLGVFPGKVIPFELSTEFSIPHMGWNQITPKLETAFLNDIEPETNFYFVHSFYVETPEQSIIATETTYGPQSFVSSIAQGPLFACQFHPEKSQEAGQILLKNFVSY